MAWWKQGLVVVLLAAAAGGLWSRLDPGAAARLERLGFPAALVRIATGAGDPDRTVTGAAPDRNAPGGKDGAAKTREILVVAGLVGEGRINDRVLALGDGEAQRSVTVVPLASGSLAEVAVQSANRVKAGDILAALDARAEIIARDRAALALRTAEEKLLRLEALVKSRTASEVQLAEARDEREEARMALRDAELKLDQRSIRAPIDGIVGIVTVEPGDYVTSQTEIATIDDRSSLMVDFWIPERFSGHVAEGQPVTATALALPGEEFPGVVSAVASRIERDSRTLRIRARLSNEADRLRPGMAFEVAMRFAGSAFPSVDPLAVQWSSNGAFVWTIVDGAAKRVPVRLIQRDSDRILVEGDLSPGDRVITEGVQAVRDGVPVRTDDEAAGAAGS